MKNSKKMNKYGWKSLLPFHCYFVKKLVQHASFFPNFFGQLQEVQEVIQQMVSANELISWFFNFFVDYIWFLLENFSVWVHFGVGRCAQEFSQVGHLGPVRT